MMTIMQILVSPNSLTFQQVNYMYSISSFDAVIRVYFRTRVRTYSSCVAVAYTTWAPPIFNPSVLHYKTQVLFAYYILKITIASRRRHIHAHTHAYMHTMCMCM